MMQFTENVVLLLIDFIAIGCMVLIPVASIAFLIDWYKEWGYKWKTRKQAKK